MKALQVGHPDAVQGLRRRALPVGMATEHGAGKRLAATGAGRVSALRRLALQRARSRATPGGKAGRPSGAPPVQWALSSKGGGSVERTQREAQGIAPGAGLRTARLPGRSRLRPGRFRPGRQSRARAHALTPCPPGLGRDRPVRRSRRAPASKSICTSTMGMAGFPPARRGALAPANVGWQQRPGGIGHKITPALIIKARTAIVL